MWSVRDKLVAVKTAMKSGLKAHDMGVAAYGVRRVAVKAAMKSGLKVATPSTDAVTFTGSSESRDEKRTESVFKLNIHIGVRSSSESRDEKRTESEEQRPVPAADERVAVKAAMKSGLKVGPCIAASACSV